MDHIIGIGELICSIFEERYWNSSANSWFESYSECNVKLFQLDVHYIAWIGQNLYQTIPFIDTFHFVWISLPWRFYLLTNLTRLSKGHTISGPILIRILRLLLGYPVAARTTGKRNEQTVPEEKSFKNHWNDRESEAAFWKQVYYRLSLMYSNHIISLFKTREDTVKLLQGVQLVPLAAVNWWRLALFSEHYVLTACSGQKSTKTLHL